MSPPPPFRHTAGRQARKRSGLLVVLSGPSGVGKGTVLAAAMRRRTEAAGRIRRSVSVTTRERRPDECEGVDYSFCTPRRFAGMVRRGELLEHASYLGHRYGTPGRWVDRQLAAGYDVVLEIEVKGAMQVRRRRPSAVLIYILPPSWQELEQRLARRRSEAEAVQRQRLAVARREMGRLQNYDYVIINDRVSRAASKLLAILTGEHARVARAGFASCLEDRDE